MNRKLVPRGITLLLMAGILTLPIAAGVVLAISALLTAMGDPLGGVVLKHIAMGCGILWVVDLAALVLAEGLNSLAESNEHDEHPKP